MHNISGNGNLFAIPKSSKISITVLIFKLQFSATFLNVVSGVFSSLRTLNRVYEEYDLLL